MPMGQSSNSGKVPWGLDTSSNLIVHVDEVPNGIACGCVCPACKASLIARHGTRRMHHFAHANSQGACEGQLHATAKLLLFQRIRTEIKNNGHIPIRWTCTECPCRHDGNLLKGVNHVGLEDHIPGPNIRPDIILYKEGVPFKLLEVVDTHFPDVSVVEYVNANGLILLIFALNVTKDIDRMILCPVLEPEIHNLTVCPCKFRRCEYCYSKPICDSYHRFCNSCQTCVPGRGLGWYRSHIHCTYCSEVIVYPNPHHESHACCYATNKWGVPICSDRNDPESHHHCHECGKRINNSKKYGQFRERCDTCRTRIVHIEQTSPKLVEPIIHKASCGKSPPEGNSGPDRNDSWVPPQRDNIFGHLISAFDRSAYPVVE